VAKEGENCSKAGRAGETDRPAERSIPLIPVRHSEDNSPSFTALVFDLLSKKVQITVLPEIGKNHSLLCYFSSLSIKAMICRFEHIVIDISPRYGNGRPSRVIGVNSVMSDQSLRQ